jgi:catechol 2,3-dioxygenase-like lactoylglutathione lyase family enzyme
VRKGEELAKLRHIAITSRDPDGTAEFYIRAFGLRKVKSASGPIATAHFLTDGTINLAVIRFHTDEAAGLEWGADFAGLHHIGFEVEDAREAARTLAAAGAVGRPDIDEAGGFGKLPISKGEHKYTGPDGVMLDVAEPGWWKYEPAEDAASPQQLGTISPPGRAG